MTYANFLDKMLTQRYLALSCSEFHNIINTTFYLYDVTPLMRMLFKQDLRSSCVQLYTDSKLGTLDIFLFLGCYQIREFEETVSFICNKV